MCEIKWNEISEKGNPKTEFQEYLVTLKNKQVSTMLFSKTSESWYSLVIVEASKNNPVIAWAKYPKPFFKNKKKEFTKNHKRK